MSDDKKKDISVDICANCGITFGLPKVVMDLWRGNHKTFFCPNGHQLCYPEDTKEEKETKSNKKELDDLKAKYKLSLEENINLSKQIEELKTELELWKPRETNEL
jgi:hypothetical protein